MPIRFRSLRDIVLLAAVTLVSGCHSATPFLLVKERPQALRSPASVGNEAPPERADADKSERRDDPGLGGAWSGRTVTASAKSPETRSGDLAVDRRFMVYTARIRLIVHDLAVSANHMREIAEQFGGYLLQSEGDSVTIRVPAEKYEAAVGRVEALGQVTSRSIQAQDVTEEYVDLEARLRNAQAVHDRLVALLQKAEDSKAALAIEIELKRVGEEIEQLTAKLTLLKSRVAFSTITAAFSRVAQQNTFTATVQLPFYWLRELNPNRLWGN